MAYAYPCWYITLKKKKEEQRELIDWNRLWEVTQFHVLLLIGLVATQGRQTVTCLTKS